MATGTIKNFAIDGGAGYCKMPDGTLIQWGAITLNTPVSQTGSQAGQLYYHEYRPTFSFPIPFYTLPTLLLSKSGGREAAIGWSAWNTTGIEEIDILSGVQTPQNPAVILQYTAIGRWK